MRYLINKYLAPRTTTHLVLFICYMTGLLMLTLLPRADRQVEPRLQLIPFETLEYWSNTIPNILLFLPLGFCLAEHPLRGVVLRAAITSLSIEICQCMLSLILSAGRYTSIDDVIFNTCGAALGYVLARGLHWRWDRGERMLGLEESESSRITRHS